MLRLDILLAISPSDTPEDLISRFNATLEAEDAEYQASPKGMAAKAEMDRKIQDAQAETTAIMSDPFLAEIASMVSQLDGFQRSMVLNQVREMASGRRRMA